MSQSEQEKPLSKWEQFKQKAAAANGPAKPWHILDPAKHVAADVAQTRYGICLSCDRLINATKQCRECGCIMTMKTKISAATCPLGKW
jgi:hypothetical protein